MIKNIPELYEKVILIGSKRKYEIGTVVHLDMSRESVLIRMCDNETIEETFTSIGRHPYGYIGYENKVDGIIVDDFPESISLYKMAMRIRDDIVTSSGILIVAVGDDDDYKTPHMHVFRSELDYKNWINGACLLFNKNAYLNHYGCNYKLTDEELSILSEKLREPFYGNISNFHNLLNSWNSENVGYELPKNIPIIKYDADTIEIFDGV